MSENVSNYQAQGGSSWNVKGALKVHSSGVLEVDGDLQMDGQQDLESGSTLNVRSGAQVQLRDGFRLNYPVVTESTGSPIDEHGVSVLDAGATPKVKAFTMDAPTAGASKTLYCLRGNATGWVGVDGGAGVQFGETAANRWLQFNAAEECVQLIGLSSVKWGIVSNVGAVAQSTSNT